MISAPVSCGYALGGAVRGPPLALSVGPVRVFTADPDLPAEVEVAVRRAVARQNGLLLSSTATATATASLEVDVFDSSLGFAPMAEPGLRAAEYEVGVRLRGLLRGADGQPLWQSPAVEGRARFIGPTGRIEAWDGAARRALVQASKDAADRLVYLLRATGPPGDRAQATSASR